MRKSKLHIGSTPAQTKLQQLVNSIQEAISSGKLKTGDVLPSVNQLSSESGFSRDTVFKAYNILKQRNLVESAPQKGYFVANESFKVFMLLDDFSAFKEQLYQAFRAELSDAYSVDLLFHHYNPQVFQQLIESSLGRYSVYIVMNIDHKSIHPSLQKIDRNKLLILDMGKPEKDTMNFIVQDFNRSVKKCLEIALPQLRKYHELILVYEEKSTPHPVETVSAVRSFCKAHQIRYRNIKQFNEIILQKGQAFFVIRDSHLVTVVKQCRAQQLKIGTDVGIISYNDTPMKQIVGGGISVITINFENLGKQAAQFVLTKNNIARVMPASIILRESL